MNQLLLKNCIKGKPNFKLKSCIDRYDNATLVAFADKQHLIVGMGEPINVETLNRKELLETLITQITTHFEKDLFYLPPREIEFVSKLMSVDFKAEDTLDYKDCSFLHSLGYVHFYNYKDKLYPVIPKELRKVYETIPKDELDSETIFNNKLYTYAVALTQIQGIYPIEHFVEVWNKYNLEKIDFEDALGYLDMMYDRQNYFNFDYQYVVTNYPSNEDGYKLLEGKWDGNITCRIPQKSEIDLYSEGVLGKESPYYEKLARLI